MPPELELPLSCRTPRDMPAEGDASLRTPCNGFLLRSGSFSVQFYLPFTKDVVWAELIKTTSPLGTEACEVSMLKGSEPAARSVNPSQPLPKGSVYSELKGIGTQRKARFTAPVQGSTVSELVVFEPQQRLRWRQLEATGSFRLAGNPTALMEDRPVPELGSGQVAAGCPEMSIELVETGEGTEVRLSYEFERIMLPPLLCWLSPVAPALLRCLMARSLPGQWRDSMVRRGHTPLMTREKAAVKVQALAKGRSARTTDLLAKKGASGLPGTSGVPGMMLSLDRKAVRSDKQRKADQDEEAQMKEAMRRRALAAAAAHA